MAYNSIEEMLVDQLVALSWIRCLQEEGYDFVNKKTNVVEKDEKVIYQAFENQTDDFDLPKAKGSHWGLEKNLLELYGSYCLYSEDDRILSVLMSASMRNLIQAKIKIIKESK